MKTPSSNLFSIIKSLNRHEKRNFKLFVKDSYESSAYIMLFDAIDSLEYYDEKKILHTLERKEWNHELKHIKQYLYESILRFLEYHYANYSIEIQLQRFLQRIEIFCAKKLFDLAKQIIKKAKDLAIKSHQYYYLNIFLSKEDEIINLQLDMAAMNNHLNSLHQEKIKCMEILANIMDYDALMFQVVSILKRELFVSGNRKEKLNMFTGNILLKNEKNALSVPAKTKHYAILGNIYFSLRDFKKSHLNYKKAIELFKKHPSFLECNVELYLDTMNYFLLATSWIKKYDQRFILFDKAKHFMDRLPKKFQSVRILRKYLIIHDNHIDFLLRMFRIQEALALSEEISANVKQYSGIDNYLVFHNNFCLVYFHLNDYHKALAEINITLNTKDVGVRTDMIIFAKIMNLIIHYELGNKELLPNLCKATQRYMKKNWHIDQLEKTLLKFFGTTIHRIDDEQESAKAFIKLKKELETALSKQVFQDFDLLAWVESKILNKPFLEVAKKKTYFRS